MSAFLPQSNDEVYCWLKARLEPGFQVTSAPAADYFSHHSYCYRILQAGEMLCELSGDYRTLRPGELVERAVKVVEELTPSSQRSAGPGATSGFFSMGQQGRASDDVPYASRLPARRWPVTWFSSGRAAFAWLLQNVVQPRIVYLPAFVCWSLIDTLVREFPETDLRFYPVEIGFPSSGSEAATTDEPFCPRLPDSFEPRSAVVRIHYFGKKQPTSPEADVTILEDYSHCPAPPLTYADAPDSGVTQLGFGSLRKLYRTADGGFVTGAYNPLYQPDGHRDAWLRLAAQDWTDLREAENMLDRSMRVSDISGQSLTTVLSTDDAAMARVRQQQDRQLREAFCGGRPLVMFNTDECPLLHCRVFESRAERDELRSYLMRHGVFTSIHWPVHPRVRAVRDDVDVESAVQMEERTLALPLSEWFSQGQVEKACEAAERWRSAGGLRIPKLPGRKPAVQQKQTT